MTNEECLMKLKLLNSLMQDMFDNMDLDGEEVEGSDKDEKKTGGDK